MQNLVVYIRLKLRSMLLAAGLSGNENNKESEFEIMMRIVFFKSHDLEKQRCWGPEGFSLQDDEGFFIVARWKGS